MPEIAPHESADSLDGTIEYADGVRQEAAMMLRSTLSFNLGGFVVAALFAAPQASAQAKAAPEPLRFEVASIKVANSGFNGVRGP
jgi:hypothetical protein